MKRLTFAIEINATPTCVWEVLWNDKTFRDWANIIDEGTYYKGTLREGGEIEFLSSVNGYGVTDLIEKLIPYETVIFRHRADTKESGQESRENEWTGGIESYTLKDKAGITQLTVATDVPLDREETFNTRFPLALKRIKRLAESRMQRIIPHLWFNDSVEDAVNLYVRLLKDSGIISKTLVPNTPSGDAMIVDFNLSSLRFNAINAGPYFKLNPSISLMVSCDSVEEVDTLFETLSVNGVELMPLGSYEFSKRYAWIQDRYGLNWQLFYNDSGKVVPKIRPTMLFAGEACGKGQEAFDFYLDVFEKVSKGEVSYYGPNEAMDQRAKINYAELQIEGSDLLLMDHGMGGDFTFNEAFSFVILCNNQEEIDYYWDKLSHYPEAEQCGWLKDPFGVSWQVVPQMMINVMENGSAEDIQNITEAFLKMKKFDVLELERSLSKI